MIALKIGECFSLNLCSDLFRIISKFNNPSFSQYSEVYELVYCDYYLKYSFDVIKNDETLDSLTRTILKGDKYGNINDQIKIKRNFLKNYLLFCCYSISLLIRMLKNDVVLDFFKFFTLNFTQLKNDEIFFYSYNCIKLVEFSFYHSEWVNFSLYKNCLMKPSITNNTIMESINSEEDPSSNFLFLEERDSKHIIFVKKYEFLKNDILYKFLEKLCLLFKTDKTNFERLSQDVLKLISHLMDSSQFSLLDIPIIDIIIELTSQLLTWIVIEGKAKNRYDFTNSIAFSLEISDKYFSSKLDCLGRIMNKFFIYLSKLNQNINIDQLKKILLIFLKDEVQEYPSFWKGKKLILDFLYSKLPNLDFSKFFYDILCNVEQFSLKNFNLFNDQDLEEINKKCNGIINEDIYIDRDAKEISEQLYNSLFRKCSKIISECKKNTISSGDLKNYIIRLYAIFCCADTKFLKYFFSLRELKLNLDIHSNKKLISPLLKMILELTYDKDFLPDSNLQKNIYKTLEQITEYLCKPSSKFNCIYHEDNRFLKLISNFLLNSKTNEILKGNNDYKTIIQSIIEGNNLNMFEYFLPLFFLIFMDSNETNQNKLIEILFTIFDNMEKRHTSIELEYFMKFFVCIIDVFAQYYEAKVLKAILREDPSAPFKFSKWIYIQPFDHCWFCGSYVSKEKFKKKIQVKCKYCKNKMMKLIIPVWEEMDFENFSFSQELMKAGSSFINFNIDIQFDFELFNNVIPFIKNYIKGSSLILIKLDTLLTIPRTESSYSIIQNNYTLALFFYVKIMIEHLWIGFVRFHMMYMESSHLHDQIHKNLESKLKELHPCFIGLKILFTAYKDLEISPTLNLIDQ